MITWLTAWGIGKITAYVGGSIAGFIILWILKKIPNGKIKNVVGKFAYGLGVGMTLGLSKWKITAGFWNEIIEKYFIDLIDNTAGEFIKKFISGLRSDN